MKDNKTSHLFNGVVSGIGDYGNCTGIPTVAGECSFDSRYNKNILVNAMTVGIAKKNKILCQSRKSRKHSFYVGSKTGKDGIHGASMSSGAFNTESETLKPTVQVGDPFYRKTIDGSVPRTYEKRCYRWYTRYGCCRTYLLCSRTSSIIKTWYKYKFR